MIAGTDSTHDVDLLRHGAMGRLLFAGVRAPSTLGTFLCSFTFGHVQQPNAVASWLLINLAGQGPLLPGAGEMAYVDVDDILKPTYGHAKQNATRGYTGAKGLNTLLALVSTASSAPVIAAARPRKGSANSACGAHRFVTDALRTARWAGASGVLVLRADSAHYGQEVVAAALRLGQRLVHGPAGQGCPQTVSDINDDAWVTIVYTDAADDEPSQQWISDTRVAEVATPRLPAGPGPIT